MKKFAVVLFVVLLLANTLLAVCAEPGAFVNSPSKNLAPVLVEAENATPECEAEIVITAYADRDKLDDHAETALVAAYDTIAATDDLSSLTPAVSALADELGIPTTDLSVSDLFDIGYTDCDSHTAHGAFTITVKPTSTEYFAGVLHYIDGEWELLSSEAEDGNITFETDTLSPFAILVHAGLAAEGSNAVAWIVAGVSVAVVAGVIVVVILLRRKKKDDPEQAA